MSDKPDQLKLYDEKRQLFEEFLRGIERCGSCDHLTAMHRTGGCWYTVTEGRVGENLVCPCTVPGREVL